MKVDSFRFCAEASLQEQRILPARFASELPRIAEFLAKDQVLECLLRGVQVESNKRKIDFLQLEARGTLSLQCQRCLLPETQPLLLKCEFLLLANPEEAEKADQDSEQDVLAHSQQFDVWELLQDEVLLNLPFAYTHEVCQLKFSQQPSPPDKNIPQPHPFAVLAKLKAD